MYAEQCRHNREKRVEEETIGTRDAMSDIVYIVFDWFNLDEDPSDASIQLRNPLDGRCIPLSLQEGLCE